MKDRLGSARWRNMAPRNPTQTRYARFKRSPASELSGPFTKASRVFKRGAKKLELPKLEEV